MRGPLRTNDATNNRTTDGPRARPDPDAIPRCICLFPVVLDSLVSITYVCHVCVWTTWTPK